MPSVAKSHLQQVTLVALEVVDSEQLSPLWRV